ncbi:phosphatase PAP2 family protein [Bacteriovoracaceae bacterium]|nr:phosphatase PAP2 family protein [Bacteriovoracaceae bacterium]
MKDLILQIKNNRNKSITIIMIVYILFYFMAQHFPLREVTILNPGIIDLKIPKIPAFIFFYILSYPLVFISFALIRKSNEQFVNFSLSFLLVSLCSIFIFLIFPNGILRNTSWIPLSSFFHTPFKLLWILDKPTNCFPSLHVSTAFVCCIYLGKIYENKKWSLLFLACLITVSTMMIRQHLFIDVLGGTTLAIISLFIPRFTQKYQ